MITREHVKGVFQDITGWKLGNVYHDGGFILMEFYDEGDRTQLLKIRNSCYSEMYLVDGMEE